MIYKIDVDANKISDAIEDFKKLGSFCIIKTTFFLDTDSDIQDIEYIKKFDIITINNYKSYANNSKTIEKWCYEKLCNEELRQYEQSEDCQRKLEELNNYMDVLERVGVNDGVEKTQGDTPKRDLATTAESSAE